MSAVASRQTVSTRAAALVLAALAAAQLACGGGRPLAEATDGQVQVEASLKGYTLSAEAAPAGLVTFTVENVDVLPHDFNLTGNGIAEHTTALEPGDTAALTLDLPAGTYTYFCAVLGHKTAGMTGTFVVK